MAKIKKSPLQKDTDLSQLAAWMTGVFNNHKQANHNLAYADVQQAIIPIWQDREDGYWFYIQQMVSEQQDGLVRQRVYHLSRINHDLMEIKIFSLKHPAEHVEALNNPSLLSSLSTDMITPQQGCSIILRRLNAESFAGSTLGEGCPGEFPGGTYSTSQLVITAHQMISWERDFDRSGKQISGATMSGYILIKQEGYDF